MHFTHNAIITENVQALVDFYTRWCSMRLVKDRREEDRRVAWLAPRHRDDLVFVVIQVERAGNTEDASLGIHYGFQLESREAVNALYREMHSAGLNPSQPADEGEIVGYIFFVKDPDGRNVEFNFGQNVGPDNWDSSCEV